MYVTINETCVTIHDTNAYQPTDEACDIIERVSKELDTEVDWGGNNDRRELYGEFLTPLSVSTLELAERLEEIINLELANKK